MAETKDVRDLTMSERLKMKKLGFSLNNADSEANQQKKFRKFEKRANKNCPSEVTSKRPVGRLRQVVEMKADLKRRDPRFDSLSGKFNEDLYEKAYDFLKDYKQDELQELKKSLKKIKSQKKRNDIQAAITQMQQDSAQHDRSNRIKQAVSKRKREEREAVEAGKNPYYLKRSEKKNIVLQAKFDELQEAGRLSKFMAKKRKKNASKDHRWLPTQRKE